MSTPTLEAPAPPPVPDATCAQVQAILDAAVRRTAAKDLNGSFKIVGGALRGGAVFITYTHDGYPRPRYHLSAERGEDGWGVTCNCDHFRYNRECKHSKRAALALPTWPSEDFELLRLMLGDDGRRAACSYCEAGTMMSVNWRRPTGLDLISWVCDNPSCGHRTVF